MMIDCDAYKGKAKYAHVEHKVECHRPRSPRNQSAVTLKNTFNNNDPFAQINTNLNIKVNKAKNKNNNRPYSSINQFKRVLSIYIN